MSSSGKKTISKLMFSNSTELRRKYDPAGFEQVHRKLLEMMQQDKKRNVSTTLIYVDDDESLKAFGVSKVDNGSDFRQVKEVVDRVAASGRFDYFLIVGGDDVIPFFQFDNPAVDEDHEVPSDNGYASSQPENSLTSKFLVPDRALGRLPDVHAESPEFLLQQIERCWAFQLLDAEQSSTYFVLSAREWEEASRGVATSLGISDKDFHTSPPVDISKRNFDTSQLDDKRIQYFNVHGDRVTAQWYGQEGFDYPPAFDPAIPARSKVSNCCVSSEACYGANI